MEKGFQLKKTNLSFQTFFCTWLEFGFLPRLLQKYNAVLIAIYVLIFLKWGNRVGWLAREKVGGRRGGRVGEGGAPPRHPADQPGGGGPHSRAPVRVYLKLLQSQYRVAAAPPPALCKG